MHDSGKISTHLQEGYDHTEDEFVMDCCEDNVHMTLLRVEGVALHIVLTDEVNVINLGDLKLVF